QWPPSTSVRSPTADLEPPGRGRRSSGVHSPSPVRSPSPDLGPPTHRHPRHAVEPGPAGRTPALVHAVGLDGVRALAVAAVLVYHTFDGVLPGGFLGVDVFFVLSGYLITSLLMVEGRQTGTIRLSRFYLRRARRLLPALYTLLIVVGGVVV